MTRLQVQIGFNISLTLQDEGLVRVEGQAQFLFNFLAAANFDVVYGDVKCAVYASILSIRFSCVGL